MKEQQKHLHENWIWKDFLQRYLGITEILDDRYPALFTLGGEFHSYAEYFTNAKSEDQITSSVNEFVMELTSKTNYRNIVVSKNKWRKI